MSNTQFSCLYCSHSDVVKQQNEMNVKIDGKTVKVHAYCNVCRRCHSRFMNTDQMEDLRREIHKIMSKKLKIYAEIMVFENRKTIPFEWEDVLKHCLIIGNKAGLSGVEFGNIKIFPASKGLPLWIGYELADEEIDHRERKIVSLIEALQKENPEGVTVREICQKSPRSIGRKKSQIEPILEGLIKKGKISRYGVFRTHGKDKRKKYLYVSIEGLHNYGPIV